MKNILSLMRVKHYIKNLLIFLPLFFSGSFTDINLVITNIIGFISFCLLASSIYIFNDVCDIEKDKLHSTKCNRPIASGKVSKTKAIILMVICLTMAVVLASKNILALTMMLIYGVLNILYLKELCR